MPGSAILLTKEEMDRHWDDKVSKTRIHHAKMNHRIRRMQAEYQHNLDAFDREHRQRMQAAEKRRATLLEQRIKNVGKCTCAQKRAKRPLKRASDTGVFNKKPFNRQLSHSANDVSVVLSPKGKSTRAGSQVDVTPGCVCCCSDSDSEDVVYVAMKRVNLDTSKGSGTTPGPIRTKEEQKEDVKAQVDVEDKKEKPEPSGTTEEDDENIFVKFLGWVGIMKEKDKSTKNDKNAQEDDAKDSKIGVKRSDSLKGNVGSSPNKTEGSAPEVGPTPTFKDANNSSRANITLSRNSLGSQKTVLYLNITPTGKLSASPGTTPQGERATISITDANITPKTTSSIDLNLHRGYVKDTAAKFLAISEAQNTRSPVTPSGTSPRVVVVPVVSPLNNLTGGAVQKVAVSVVQADKKPTAVGATSQATSKHLVVNGDSKTEIQIVINQM